MSANIKTEIQNNNDFGFTFIYLSITYFRYIGMVNLLRNDGKE